VDSHNVKFSYSSGDAAVSKGWFSDPLADCLTFLLTEFFNVGSLIINITLIDITAIIKPTIKTPTLTGIVNWIVKSTVKAINSPTPLPSAYKEVALPLESDLM
jgi:hypothetical protein